MDEAGTAADDLTFDGFLKEVCSRYELDWRKYRRHAARRHLDERLQLLRLTTYEQYLDLLRRDPGETELLPDLLRVTVSRFFREREHWDFLGDEIMPALLARRGKDRRLRAWCAGCCNGEEPYSLAMLITILAESGLERAAGMEIIATDVDSAVLGRAAAGIYGKSSMREVPPELSQRFFTREGEEYRLDDSIRNMVEFREHNLRIEAPPGRIDLLLCRYLIFTYYTGERRFGASTSLWRSLEDGGVLMTGRKDRLGPRELELFEPWPGTDVFFRKRS